MIRGKASPAPAPFVAALTDKARLLGAARAEERLREARRDPWRWRMARLLWPSF